MDVLLHLKKGVFTFDFIENKVLLNHEIFSEKIHIFNEISNWFHKDLAAYRIEKNNILKATLMVDFTASRLEGEAISRSKNVFSIAIKMKSLITTDECRYEAQKERMLYHHPRHSKTYGFE